MDEENQPPALGHNSGDSPDKFAVPDAGARLRSIIERVERLEEEKSNIGDDIRDIYAVAKSDGYDVKCLRKLVSLRKQDPDKRREEQALLDLYASSIGMEL